MRPLNATLVARSPRVTVMMCGLLGFGTTPFLAPPLDALPVHGLWAFLIGSAIWFVILWVASRFTAPRVHVDLGERRLRVRGRDYSFYSLRTATRRFSAYRGAVSLTFRFTLDDGRRFRILAHGSPFPGLSGQWLDLLHAMVQTSTIEEPSDPPPHQRMSSPWQAGKEIPVGRTTILREIDGLRARRPAPATAADLGAREHIQQHTGALRRIRRVSGITAIVVIVALLCLGLSLPLVEEAGSNGWSAAHPLVEPLGGAGSLIAVLAAVTWMVSADAWVRRVRRLGDTWWDEADSAARVRGLPRPYLRVEASGARRTWQVLLLSSLLLVVLLVTVALDAVSAESDRAFLALIILAVILLLCLGIVSWRRSRRDQRLTAGRLASRGGAHAGVQP